jgi:hypothetical protein
MKNAPDPYSMEERGTSRFGVSADDYLDARTATIPTTPTRIHGGMDHHPFKAAEVRGDIRYDKPRHEVLIDWNLLNVQSALVRACPEKYEMGPDGKIKPLNLTAKP